MLQQSEQNVTVTYLNSAFYKVCSFASIISDESHLFLGDLEDPGEQTEDAGGAEE